MFANYALLPTPWIQAINASKTVELVSIQAMANALPVHRPAIHAQMELSAYRARTNKCSKELFANKPAIMEASTKMEFVWPVSKVAINALELPLALKVRMDTFW